jgi:hypothetical protein
MALAMQLNWLELKNRDGKDVVARNMLNCCKKWADLMHCAVSSGALDPMTRAGIALRCTSMCLKGLRVSKGRQVSILRCLLDAVLLTIC